MEPLRYAFMHLALLVLGYTAALLAWRAAYRAYQERKREREAAATVARIEEQDRLIAESLTAKKDKER